MKNRGKFVFLKFFILVNALIQIPGLTPGVRAEDILLPKGTQITLQLNDTLSTASNMEGDEFTAAVSTPVHHNDRIVIPQGSVVTGSVSRILRPDRLKGKAVLELIFQSIQVPGYKTADIAATLVQINSGGSGGTLVGDNFSERKKTSGDAVKPGSSQQIGVRPQPSGGKNNGIGASGGLPSVFNSQGGDLTIPRGVYMDITLDRQLTIAEDPGTPAGK